MTNGEILRQVADHLSDCCQTIEQVSTALSEVMLLQDIPAAETPRNVWHQAVIILGGDGTLRLLKSMRPGFQESAAFQSACALMETFRSDSERRKDDVEVSGEMWLTPIGLHEHSRKAEVYVGANVAPSEQYVPLSKALLEIGPIIAAQESDLDLADNLQSLGALLSEDSFRALVENPNHSVVEVRRIHDFVREQIEDMRRIARSSIELKHFSAAGERLPFEPIQVVLECKLKHTENALATLKGFAQAIIDFERESQELDGSGTEGRRLVERLMALCSAAQRLVGPLEKSLKGRLSLVNEVIPEFLANPVDEVSLLLKALRPDQRFGTPAPTLWEPAVTNK